MSLEEAQRLDREGRLVEAAAAYEEALGQGEGTVTDLLDLAVLYWQATDPGMAAAHHWDGAWVSHAARRAAAWLEEASRRFPRSAEAQFWQSYIRWADLGEPFELSACRQLLRDAPDHPVPALYLFSAAQGQEAEAEARALLGWCDAHGTMRARYVASVIRAVFRRRRKSPGGGGP